MGGKGIFGLIGLLSLMLGVWLAGDSLPSLPGLANVALAQAEPPSPAG
jgi:hypothetical protein